MAKYCLKKPSKRMSCKKKYKIQKKVREHNRKTRKEKKKADSTKRPEKLISVPNKCPFKEQILVEAEQKRQLIQKEKEKKKVLAKELKKTGTKRGLNEESEGLADLAKKAKLRHRAFENNTEAAGEENGRGAEGRLQRREEVSLKVYAGEVRKTIENSDVIIQILDARDPLGSRALSVEKSIMEKGKKLVLLLNKIDLVPKENVQNWLSYLRKEYPTLAFKASTQEQVANLGRSGSNLSSLNSKCLGAELVMKLLGNYCRNKDIKTAITVGIIGYPNVGKSSVINSLKRKRTCNVGATPGVTKQMQAVQLDKHVKLLDSPGVVLSGRKGLDPCEVALRNAVRVEALEDPVAPVQAILRRCTKDTLMLQYKLGEFSDCEEFLALVARKCGRLKKGARPDIRAAATQVLTDWNSGKLRYYTQPPEESMQPTEGAAVIVSQMAKEFSLDDLDKDQSLLIQGLSDKNSNAIVYNSTGALADDLLTEENEEVIEDMEVEKKSKTVVQATQSSKKGQSTEGEKMAIEVPKTLKIDGNQQINRAIKTAVKKQKKKHKKTGKEADKLADSLGSAMDIQQQEDYDFSQMG